MKIRKIVSIAAFLTILGLGTACSPGSLGASAQSNNTGAMGGLLGGGLGNGLGTLLEGVFSSSNLTVADLEGNWTSTGPAVCFQSEDFLKKAGGIAMATAVENKLKPYYDKYGLNDAQMAVNPDGTFTLTMKAIKLSGNITPKRGAEKGVFDFNFTILGQKLATVPAYIQKTSQSMDVMFDASKLVSLFQAVSQFSGNNLVSGLSSIVGSYDGLCVGFKFHGGKTGNSNSGLGGLLDMLGGGSNQNNGSSQTTTTPAGNGNSGGGLQSGKIKH